MIDNKLLQASLAFLRAGFLLWAALCCGGASSQSSGYGQQEWKVRQLGPRDGVPPRIKSMLQDRNGFVWLGTIDGVYRYDGTTFQRVAPMAGAPMQSPEVISLLALPNGDVWAGHDWGGLSLIRGTRTVAAMPLSGAIFSMAQNRSGQAWAFGGGVGKLTAARLASGRWTVDFTVHAEKTFGDGVVAPDGTVWFVLDGRIWIRPLDGKLRRLSQSPFDLQAFVFASPDGQPWLFLKGKVRSIISSASTRTWQVGPAFIDVGPLAATIAFDGHDKLWIRYYDGSVARFEQAANLGTGQVWKKVNLSPLNLPEGERSIKMMVDQENNVWLPGSSDLYHLTRTTFVAVTSKRESGDSDPIMMRDSIGSVWIRNGHYLFSADKEGKLKRLRFKAAAKYTPCVGYRGGVWRPSASGSMDLVGASRSRSLPLTGVHSFGRNSEDRCVEDSRGRLWVTDGSELKILSPRGAKLVELGDDTKHGSALAMAADTSGRVLVAIGRDSVWQSDGTRSIRIWRHRDKLLGFVEVVLPTQSGMLLGGDQGLVRYDGSHFKLLSRNRFPFLAYVSGIAQTDTGETWIQSLKGIFRLRSGDIDRAFDQPNIRLSPQAFGLADGLPGLGSFRKLNSIAVDASNRVWAMTDGGIAYHDPVGMPRDRPPPVAVVGLQADGKAIPLASSTRLPLGVSRVQIDYAGLSFARPEKLRFRYRLEDVDIGWVDGGGTRSATYTSLRPGRYRFHVVAAANGIWNTQGATAEFIIPARFFQTRWFLALCGLAVAGAAWLLYRWRFRAAATRLRQQMSVRLSERERIAREIHDTLLQGVQGLLLRLQALANRMPTSNADREFLEATLSRTQAILIEGRDRMLDLRSPRLENDLKEMLGELVGNTGIDLDFSVKIFSSGAEKPVSSGVGGELREIVKEALNNAARHSRCQNLEISLDFGYRLVVTIVDDGVGMPPNPLSGAPSVRFGLIGMQERASRIGAKLSILSSVNGGTKIVLRVPASSAFP